MGFVKHNVTIEMLFDAVKERLNLKDQPLIKKAYEVAERTHADQKPW